MKGGSKDAAEGEILNNIDKQRLRIDPQRFVKNRHNELTRTQNGRIIHVNESRRLSTIGLMVWARLPTVGCGQAICGRKLAAAQGERD